MLRIHNTRTYCFSAAIMVAQKHLNINVIRTLSVLFLLVWLFERKVIVPLHAITFLVLLYSVQDVFTARYVTAL
jgi:hypothetical protein